MLCVGARTRHSDKPGPGEHVDPFVFGRPYREYAGVPSFPCLLTLGET